MLDPIQYKLLFLFTTLAEPGAGSRSRRRNFENPAPVPAPRGSGSTTLKKTIRSAPMVENVPTQLSKLK